MWTTLTFFFSVLHFDSSENVSNLRSGLLYLQLLANKWSTSKLEISASSALPEAARSQMAAYRKRIKNIFPKHFSSWSNSAPWLTFECTSMPQSQSSLYSLYLTGVYNVRFKTPSSSHGLTAHVDFMVLACLHMTSHHLNLLFWMYVCAKRVKVAPPPSLFLHCRLFLACRLVVGVSGCITSNT